MQAEELMREVAALLKRSDISPPEATLGFRRNPLPTAELDKMGSTAKPFSQVLRVFPPARRRTANRENSDEPIRQPYLPTRCE